MIANIISYSIHNRFLILLMTGILLLAGIYSLKETPVDAIPDLSDVQVIIKTRFPGQAPQVVEDQVTYPLTTAMLSVPGALTVRGYSFFGDSYVYVIFKDGTDMYWARSRVLEYLSQVVNELPANAKPALGPDATGVGWVFQYALVDKTGNHDISQLRAIQDWFLKYELQTVPGVAEIATVGGMDKQYQVVIDPNKLRAYSLSLTDISKAIKDNNQETGASVIEMAEAEYMIRASGYIQSIENLKQIPLKVSKQGTPLLLGDIADIRLGPEMRRGIAELDGSGEVVGGIVLMRFGENAVHIIDGVKQKIERLKAGLPKGVEIVTTYDRSTLINHAVTNLQHKLIEEFMVVALVCALFLFHLRSALVVVVSLPLGILAAFIIMHAQGLNANIMSLGGIAIAIGAMVDATIVMIENMHKHMERTPLTDENRWQVVTRASEEVGPPLFFSLLIITLSFLPVFTLEAQEGKMFAPLAFTKTYAMAAAAGLSITLVPVLMGYFIRGHVIHEEKNPINRYLIKTYKPILSFVLRFPKMVLGAVIVVLIVGLWPFTQVGSEFMPPLDEGDLMYMPTTHPGISIGKAKQLLQQTDKLIKQQPEVARVFGKIGRANTATDPAPLTMIETVIQLKPKSQWRDGITTEQIKRELNDIVKIPGLTNAWVMPIKTRIDMLATGIKTPVGIKVSGPKLDVIEDIGKRLEKILKDVPGTASVYAERVDGGRYVSINIDRKNAARYGLSIAYIQQTISAAIGGMRITQTVEGRERYPVNLRYPQTDRDSVEKIKLLPLITPIGAHIALADVAEVKITNGPPAIKSENARLTGWVLVDIDNRDLGSYVQAAQMAVQEKLKLDSGYALSWSGQYEYMMRAKERLAYVVPITVAIIALLLFLNFRNFVDVLIIMGTLPMAVIGGIWFMYLLGFNMSVATGVGFIALSGVAVEIGVLMLVYLHQSLKRTQEDAKNKGQPLSSELVKQAVLDGAALRVRPIMMTFAAIFAGLLPIMYSSGTGSEVMQRIAAPMLGGMLSTLVLTLLIIPVIYWIRCQINFSKQQKEVGNV